MHHNINSQLASAFGHERQRQLDTGANVYKGANSSPEPRLYPIHTPSDCYNCHSIERVGRTPSWHFAIEHDRSAYGYCRGAYDYDKSANGYCRSANGYSKSIPIHFYVRAHAHR